MDRKDFIIWTALQQFVDNQPEYDEESFTDPTAEHMPAGIRHDLEIAQTLIDEYAAKMTKMAE